MGRLTRSQVRARTIVLVALSVATPILVLLGMLSAGRSEWFWLLLFFIDVPEAVVLGLAEWIDRSAA